MPTKIILLAFAITLSGCATFKGRTTYVKVVTDPPGAEVLVNGKKSVGITPLFAPVPRQKHASLLIRSSAGSIERKLEGSYRWQESFFANFGWITPVLWGVGWGTDLITGACWDYDAIDLQSLPKATSSGALLHPVRLVAVAPPVSGFELLSEEMGLEVQKALARKLPKAVILPYDQTSETFVAFNSTYRSDNDPRFNDELYQDLGVSHLARTVLERDGAVTRAKITLHDVFLEKDVGSMQIEVANDELSSISRNKWKEIVLRSVSLIPNSIGVQLVATQSTRITARDDAARIYGVESQRESSFFDYASRISIRNVPHPKSMRGFKGRFRFIPDVAYTNDKFRLVQSAGPSTAAIGIQFRYQTIHAGLGPELGLETPAGYLYLQALPVFSATWIYFDRGGVRSYEHRSQTAVAVEVGFMFWVTDNINMRLYTNSLSSNKDVWTNVFQRAGTGLTATDASTTVGGFAIGYYFPGVKKIARNSLL